MKRIKVEFRQIQFSRVRMALSATPVTHIEDDIRKKAYVVSGVQQIERINITIILVSIFRKIR